MMQTLFYACINVSFEVVNMQLMCQLNVNLVNRHFASFKVDMFPRASLQDFLYVYLLTGA